MSFNLSVREERELNTSIDTVRRYIDDYTTGKNKLKRKLISLEDKEEYENIMKQIEEIENSLKNIRVKLGM